MCVYVCGGVSEEPKETDTNLLPPMTQPYILCIYLIYFFFLCFSQGNAIPEFSQFILCLITKISGQKRKRETLRRIEKFML